MTASPTMGGADVARPRSAFSIIAPIILAVFVVYLTIGMALPVLPLHVHDALGMNPVIVGIVVGSQFAAALLSRVWAGNLADTRGATRSVIAGGGLACLSGLAYWASLAFVAAPATSVVILVIGRLLLGCAESFVITGAFSYAIGLLGRQRAGAAMVWIGVSINAAYSIGAPLGSALYEKYGFLGAALATAAIPLLTLGFVLFMRDAPRAERHAPIRQVIGAIWLPGLGLACVCAGFSTLSTFVALFFADRSWGDASLAFTVFGIVFIVARVMFGGLPDRIGGARVALVCALIEAIGQLVIWRASTPAFAYLGSALTGFGYSLAFPGFGVEAIKRAPPQSRGAAMGAYMVFLDVSLMVASPLAGGIANHFGVGAVYLAGGAIVAGALLIALRLLAKPFQTS